MWISVKDSHGLYISCLGTKHTQASLSNSEGCPHCPKFSVKSWEWRLCMAVAGKSDPCLSAQTREEPMDCPQASSLWGKMMERVSPAPLFEDPLLGEGDDEDKVLSAILEDEDDDDEDAILPPIQSCPPSAQDASSPSPVQTERFSVMGWGAVFEGRTVSWVWSPTLREKNISFLELLTVLLALRPFVHFLKNHHVLVRTDNTIVIAYINRQAVVHSHKLHLLAK